MHIICTILPVALGELTLGELTSFTSLLQAILYVPRFYTVSPSFKVPLYQRFYSLTFMEFQRVLSMTPKFGTKWAFRKATINAKQTYK